MNNDKYLSRFFLLNLILALYHMSVFLGCVIGIGSGVSQVDINLMSIPILIIGMSFQFLLHSIPNIILYKKLSNIGNISIFIKTEIIIFLAMIISYLVLYVASSTM